MRSKAQLQPNPEMPWSPLKEEGPEPKKARSAGAPSRPDGGARSQDDGGHLGFVPSKPEQPQGGPLAQLYRNTPLTRAPSGREVGPRSSADPYGPGEEESMGRRGQWAMWRGSGWAPGMPPPPPYYGAGAWMDEYMPEGRAPPVMDRPSGRPPPHMGKERQHLYPPYESMAGPSGDHRHDDEWLMRQWEAPHHVREYAGRYNEYSQRMAQYDHRMNPHEARWLGPEGDGVSCMSHGLVMKAGEGRRGDREDRPGSR